LGRDQQPGRNRQLIGPRYWIGYADGQASVNQGPLATGPAGQVGSIELLGALLVVQFGLGPRITAIGREEW